MAGLSLFSLADAGVFSAVTVLATIYTTYSILLVIYRLFFHPLSKVPGPWLAAATKWYETYYELVPNGGGAFTKHIKKLHEQYGPIIRINPTEVHIDDPEYYETIYAPLQPYDKLVALENRLNMPRATFMTANAEVHEIRRKALAPFFAPNKIRGHEPLIQGLIDNISRRLRTEYAGRNKVLTLNDVYGCLSGDVITNLAFARSYNLIGSEHWDSPFTIAVNNLVHTTHYTAQFQWIIPLSNLIPDKVLSTIAPLMGPIIQFRQEMEKQIRDILSGNNVDVKEANHKTVFVEILQSNLPPEQTTVSRLQNEAVSVVGAGFETTRWALTVGSYHILANPDIRKKLREELEQAIPDPGHIPDWGQLSRLPYLTGCIELLEPALRFSVALAALRLGYGVVQRSPRVSRHSAFQYREYTIPPGTGVSSDSYHMHHHEGIFPDSFTFRPERWLGEPRAPSGKLLTRYNVAFGRGTRACLGLPMAYCEIYLTLATLFRRFDFELYETGPENVMFHRDMLTPQPPDGSKGVRVLVK